VAEAGYKVADIDFSSQVARMKAAGTDLIVIATVTRETVGIMSEVKKLGWTDVKVLTGNPGRTGIVLQLGKDTVEGLYGVGVWKAGTDAPEVKGWKDSFKKRFNNMEPDENALLSYVYTDWFVKGLAAAGRDVTADKVAKALQTTGYDDKGLIFYGPKSFKANHIDPETVRVDQATGGRWVSVSDLLQ
jgi:ABC-type branched-subunit amino acid transport system substrate-binding protein